MVGPGHSGCGSSANRSTALAGIANRPLCLRQLADGATKMTSDRQYEANRRNAKRSTGPKTVEGKRRSRTNALRHGLTAITVVDKLEKPAEYRAIEEQLLNEYGPSSVLET